VLNNCKEKRWFKLKFVLNVMKKKLLKNSVLIKIVKVFVKDTTSVNLVNLLIKRNITKRIKSIIKIKQSNGDKKMMNSTNNI